MSIQKPTGRMRDFGCMICKGPNVRPVETVWLSCTKCIRVLSWVLAGEDPQDNGATAEECAVVQRYLDAA
jgi:hypothetical protein